MTYREYCDLARRNGVPAVSEEHWKATHAQARICPHCQRSVAVCDADERGCGSTPAGTWRDRAPLL